MGAPRTHGNQRPGHVPRPLEDAPGIVVAQVADRLLQAAPPTRGDALGRLGNRLGVRGLKQEEMAELVDEPTPEPEVPIDDPDGAVEHQVGEAGLLGGFADGSLGRTLPLLQVPLRQSPVVVAVANDQEANHLVRPTTKHDPACADLALGPSLWRH